MRARNAPVEAGFYFFATLAGVSTTRVIEDPIFCLIAAGISAGLGFFANLVAERRPKNNKMSQN